MFGANLLSFIAHIYTYAPHFYKRGELPDVVSGMKMNNVSVEVCRSTPWCSEHICTLLCESLGNGWSFS